MLNFFVKDFFISWRKETLLVLNKKIKFFHPTFCEAKRHEGGSSPFVTITSPLISYILFIYFLIFYILTTVRSKYIKKLTRGRARYYKQTIQIPKKPFSPQENFC